MASSEFGALVDSELDTLGINTNEEVADFRALPRRGSNNMVTVLDNISTARSNQFVSRKRMRSDALRLFHEGAL